MRPAHRMGALALAAAAAACGGDRREAERAVRAYDEAVILAYRTGNLSKLEATATDRERGKVRVLVDLKAQGRHVLESELRSLEVTAVERPGPGRLTARTRERWRYWDRPLDPGKPQGTVFVADMAMEYVLVRAGGAWKTDSVRTLSNDFVEPAGHRIAPGHRGANGAPARHDSR